MSSSGLQLTTSSKTTLYGVLRSGKRNDNLSKSNISKVSSRCVHFFFLPFHSIATPALAIAQSNYAGLWSTFPSFSSVVQ